MRDSATPPAATPTVPEIPEENIDNPSLEFKALRTEGIPDNDIHEQPQRQLQRDTNWGYFLNAVFRTLFSLAQCFAEKMVQTKETSKLYLSTQIESFRLTSSFDHSRDYTEHFTSSENLQDLETEQEQVGRWRKVRKIGQGSCGAVYLERKEHGKQLRALKVVCKEKMLHAKLDYTRELQAMASLQKYPKEFVSFNGWFEDEINIHISMEFCIHSDLSSCFKGPLPEAAVAVIVRQVRSALEIMHKEGFTHRDLKPKNIFVVSTCPISVKLGDFGISKRIQEDNTQLRTRIYTKPYAAPEVLDMMESGKEEYTSAVDIWSLGCVSHQLLTNAVPFKTSTDLDKYCRGDTVNANHPARVLEGQGISKDGIEFVLHLLAPNPDNRPTAATAGNHRWLYIDDTTREPNSSLPQGCTTAALLL
ncbi:kinase-like domain-containing protein [Trichophaea hybrida]|nr:kinase-like domain-containing protein [Trichophaea hybrida]